MTTAQDNPRLARPGLFLSSSCRALSRSSSSTVWSRPVHWRKRTGEGGFNSRRRMLRTTFSLAPQRAQGGALSCPQFLLARVSAVNYKGSSIASRLQSWRFAIAGK